MRSKRRSPLHDRAYDRIYKNKKDGYRQRNVRQFLQSA